MFEFFATKGFQDYLKQAQRLLVDNWTGHYTRPSPGLYPHQWNWDSGFIALGYAHFDQQRAMTELRSLFAQQWENGMLPHIVFNSAYLGHYFPEPDFWQVPGGRPTSGITMPPLHAMAVRRIYQLAQDRGKATEFLAEMFPRLLALHRYLYVYRDPQREGLVYIRHPWESGLDNSPSWDGPLGAIPVDKSRLPVYRRRDLDHGVPAEQRPSDDDYDRYVYLVDLFRRHGYDEQRIHGECPFLIQDVLFNSILCRANRDLLEIGKILGQDLGQVREWLSQTTHAISQKMWSAQRRQFDPFDLVGKRRLPTATAASFMPLFAVAASNEQAQTLYEHLDSVGFCALHQGNCFTIPNFDMAQDQFDPRNYWRGPVWLNINWMLSQGLKSYGFKEKADAMQKDMIQLPVRFGFHEYFDSISGTGYGSDSFSWTAALFIDLVQEYYAQDRHGPGWRGLAGGRKIRETLVLNEVPGVAPEPMPELGKKLMGAIADLRDAFHDKHRGRVDYRAMKGSGQYRDYRQLSAHLQAFDLEELRSDQERLAFWINLYNTIVVQGIVELSISSSMREVSNFFRCICYRIGENLYTPDDIEHGILRSNARPPYRLFKAFRRGDPRARHRVRKLDPRIHFALVCGSRSCAPIRFYERRQIHQQLEAAARSFVNSSEVVILPERDKVLLSQIFNWYSRDFGGQQKVFDFLLKYLDQDDKAQFLADRRYHIQVEYLFYDWNLNH